MTLLEVISRADGLRPNTIPAEVKAGWVYELEAEFAEMMGLKIPANPYPENAELLMPDGYANSYVWQVCLLIDLSNKDTEVYALDAQTANEAKARAKAHYRRNHRSEKTAWRT